VSILHTCRVNDVIAIEYGDQAQERVCRVIEVRDMTKQPLSPKSLSSRPYVQRSDRLVTCQSTNGQIRAFYAGVKCAARPIPKLKAAWLYLRRKLPARKTITC